MSARVCVCVSTYTGAQAQGDEDTRTCTHPRDIIHTHQTSPTHTHTHTHTHTPTSTPTPTPTHPPAHTHTLTHTPLTMLGRGDLAPAMSALMWFILAHGWPWSWDEIPCKLYEMPSRLSIPIQLLVRSLTHTQAPRLSQCCAVTVSILVSRHRPQANDRPGQFLARGIRRLGSVRSRVARCLSRPRR